MLSYIDKCWLTISAIEYSDCYEKNYKLFNKAIRILQSLAREEKIAEELSDNEIDILIDTFNIMEEQE